MRSFAEAYPAFTMVQPPAAQLQDVDNQVNKFLQARPAKIENISYLLITLK